MHVFATFEQTLSLEMALTSLEHSGIAPEQILAVPLVKQMETRKLFDSIHRADGVSLFDAAAVFGTIFMLLGTIYGYVLKWGPIIWGIIGAVFGLLLGFFIKYAIIKNLKEREKGRNNNGITSEVVVIIRCEDLQWPTVEKILWENNALGVSKLKNKESV